MPRTQSCPTTASSRAYLAQGPRIRRVPRVRVSLPPWGLCRRSEPETESETRSSEPRRRPPRAASRGGGQGRDVRAPPAAATPEHVAARCDRTRNLGPVEAGPTVLDPVDHVPGSWNCFYSPPRAYCTSPRPPPRTLTEEAPAIEALIAVVADFKGGDRPDLPSWTTASTSAASAILRNSERFPGQPYAAATAASRAWRCSWRLSSPRSIASDRPASDTGRLPCLTRRG